MNCSKCGAENPDYPFYCGRCAAELRGLPADTHRGTEPHKVRSEVKIETILSRNLLRIEENARKRRQGVFGRLRGAFWKSGSLVFKSDQEEVALVIDKEGHAAVRRGPSEPTIELVGPHESFISMFRDEHDVRSIPDSIAVRIAGRDLPNETSQLVFRDGIEKLLHALFE